MTTSATTRLTPLRTFGARFGNPIVRRFAGWLPGFGILGYRGRTSGRSFRTPINVYRHGDGVVFALAYGVESQWVRNVQAAGGATLRSRGRDLSLVEPELFEDLDRRSVPPIVRWIYARIGVRWFLRMRVEPMYGSPPPPRRG